MLRSCELRVSRFNLFMESTEENLRRQREGAGTNYSVVWHAVHGLTSKDMG